MFKPLSPKSIHPPFGNYVHGVEIPANAKIVQTSGQLGISKDGAIPDNAAAQADICFHSIEAILAEAGLSLSAVVHLRTYVTNREDFASYMQVRDRFFPDNPPASTLLIVTGFTRPEFLVEIEALAIATA